MKQAKGFITEDGRFFENEVDAEYHEARNALAVTVSDIEIADGRYADPDKYIEVLLLSITETERLANAYRKAPEYAQRYEEELAEARRSSADFGRGAVSDADEGTVQGNGAAASQGVPYRGGRENPPGVQQFPFGRYESVSDMGRSQRAEDVQDEC